MHNVEGKVVDCYYLEGRVRDMGQAAKALVRSCQDILTPALCGGFTVTIITIINFLFHVECIRFIM